MLNTDQTLSSQEIEILPPLAEAPSLAKLEAIIRREHAAVGTAFSRAIEHALVVGRALIEVKKHGNWRPSLKRCDLGERQGERYVQLVRRYDANPSRRTDLAGLSIQAAIKRLAPAQPQSAASTGSRAAKSKACATTTLDIVDAWMAAPLPERQRAVSNIGAEAILELFPLDWAPVVERWLGERRTPVASSPVLIETDSDGFPVMPGFLRRAPAMVGAR